MTQLLQVENLSVQLPSESEIFYAVNKINFSINRGETLALVGESGSGKSLTALAILQLLPKAARISLDSKILLEGMDLLDLPEVALRKIRGRRVSMIFQEASSAFNPVLTIGEQIVETLKCHFRMTAKARKQRVLTLLNEVGINEPQRCARSYAHQLSGGQRQRALIAMALAPEPDLLVADEPTTALDVTLQAQILELLQTIREKSQMGLLFITHDLGIVQRIADRVAVICHGEIVEQASKTDFFKVQQHPYSRRLFAAVPSFTARSDEQTRTTPSSSLLTVRDLKIYFPIKKGILQRTVDYVRAVTGVNFAVNRGRTLALVGESGCGKTTIAKGIVRLVQSYSGEIKFLNQSLTRLSYSRMQAIRGALQMVFQDPYASMNPRLRVDQIIAEGMLAQNLAENLRDCYTKIDELLLRVGLTVDCKYRFPHEFSGGQRQRICIARALAMQPQLIICDEPTSALDVIVQMDILKLLQSLQQELGIAYLLITHNFGVVAYLAHEVAVMRHGKIIEQGPVEQVLSQPQQDYTKQLLAAVPKI